MHYIRFLKSPICVPSPKTSTGFQLNSKITITSDLGESFLCADIDIVAVLIEEDDRFSQQNHMIFGWKAGMRQLEVSWKVTTSARGAVNSLQWPCRLAVYALQKEHSPRNIIDVLDVVPGGDGYCGSIMRAESLPFTLKVSSEVKRVKRCLELSSQDHLVLWEDTGESIARHIWDAGLLLSAYLSSLQTGFERSKIKEISMLKRILARPQSRVLELGAGCGIIGITLASVCPGAEVIMTDLPEAEEIVKHNISKNVLGCKNCDRIMTVAYQNLDWSDTLDSSVGNAKWDLIVAGDVTYNSDVAPDLVATMVDCLKYNKDAPILVAMKIRHDSEKIFFELMKENKLYIIDTVTLPVPVLGEEDQEIIIYLFHRNPLAK